MNTTITRPRRRYGVWVVAALLIAGGAYYWSTQTNKKVVQTLSTSAVTRGSLVESIASTGTLSATDEVTVGSQVSGIVTKVLVDYNDEVKKGQLLAVIDPQTLQAQVDSARQTMTQRQTSYDEAVRQLEEGKRLYQEKYLSDRDLRALEVTAATDKAQLESATIDFNKQNVQLTYAEIRSPIDGVIMTRGVDPGNTVQSSMSVATMFVVASDLTKMKILASVDETQIAQIKEGMKATFTVSGISNKTFNAKVRQVRLKSTTSNNVVTYTVVLDAENPEKLLFPGMTATIDFILSSIDDKLLVPSAALRVNVPDALRAASEQGQNMSGMSGMPGPNGGNGSMPAGDMSGMPMPQGGQNGGPPAGFDGQANGQGMQGSGQGMSGMSGGGGRNSVWLVNAEGKAYRVPVRVLGSDLTNTAIEPMREGALNEGDQVVIRVVDPSGSSSAASANSSNNNDRRRDMMMMQGPGGFGGGGGGGMGPG